MSVTKQKFVDLAAKLARQTFADFFKRRFFIRPESKNPVTGNVTADEIIESINCVRIDYKANQVDGQVIQAGDFQLLAEVSEFSLLNPETNGVVVYIDGVFCQIINAEKDAADATWIIQLREGGPSIEFVVDIEELTNGEPIEGMKIVDQAINQEWPE